MIEQLFPTPIYRAKLNNSVVQQRFEEVHADLSSKDRFQYKEGWRTHRLNDTTFTTDLITEYHLKDFLEEISNHLGNYFQALRFEQKCYWEIHGCWMTSFLKGDYAHLHTHVPADISGVYYVKATGNDGRFYFLNPNKSLTSTTAFCGTDNRYFYPPEEGVLMLFPGWIDHGVEPNRTDDERVSVSFNIKLKV